MYRIVCAVNESLYYQMLCKGLLHSLLRHRYSPVKLTVLLDGRSSRPLEDIGQHIEIVPVNPLDLTCGCVPSRTTFARLEIPYLFSRESRVLYLDVDTYVMRNIDELFTVPFQTVAAVVPGTSLMIKDLLERQFKTSLTRMHYELDGVQYSCGSEDHLYFNAGTSSRTEIDD